MASELETHKQMLDGIFERYLSLLDEYQTAQQELCSCMSAGFLSLAQANRSAPAGIRRYGQDYYDNRMQSGRRVLIENDNKISHFSVIERSPQDPPDQNEKDDTNIEPKTGKNGTDPPQLASNEREENSKLRKAKNPIRWYGFSVPSSLRVAQAQFTTVVETPVPRILHVTQEMRQLENEIGRLRKTIRKLENS